jgi:peptidoglycan/xylan/chitin deacetylase (PgdA/CDA1 family)
MLGRVVKSTAAAADVVRPHRPGAVVLCYHRVGGRSGAREIDLPTALFERQIAEIADRAISLTDVLPALTGDAPIADEPVRRDVVVTFDDGTEDFVEHVLPILERYHVPAVLYVATAHIDDGRPFPAGGRPLSWSALRDASSTGLVEIGSHTHTHVLFDRCETCVVEYELDHSMALIAKHVGYRPAHFAYPKALAPRGDAAMAVARRFMSAALAGTRPNPYGRTDRMRLARSPIQRSDGMHWFRAKADGGMALEDGLRRLANRFRYAGASS